MVLEEVGVARVGLQDGLLFRKFGSAVCSAHVRHVPLFDGLQ
jgi:hypothetical protein